jgi:hypothetical protein
MNIKVHQFTKSEEAQGKKQQWLASLPKVPSAYKPSGKMSEGAMGWMVAAAVLGVPLALAVGLAVCGAGAAISLGLASLLESAGEGGGRGVFMLGIGTLAAVLGTFFGMYSLIGLTASHMVVVGGKRAKNRSKSSASAVSIVAALAAVAGFWILAMRISPTIVDSEKATTALTTVFGTGEIGLACLAIGAICAAVVAGSHASVAVEKAKFCETCELFMTPPKSTPVAFEDAVEACRALQAGSIEGAAAMAGKPVEASEGSVNLSRCPKCGCGFVEISVSFIANWPKKAGSKEMQSLTESWQVASKALGPAEMRLLEESTKQKETPKA